MTHSSIQEPGCGSTPRCRGGRVSDGATQASKATLRSVWRICISIRLIKASQLHLIGLPQEVVEQSGVKVVVDPFSLQYLEGAQIDFIDSLMGGGFTVVNPNAVKSCACGQSFDTSYGGGAAKPCH